MPDPPASEISSLDAALDNLILEGGGDVESEEGDAPKQAPKSHKRGGGKGEKKEKPLTPITVPPAMVAGLARRIFGTAAVAFGPHWELTEKEAEEMGVYWSPVVAQYLPEILRKHFALLMAVLMTLILVAGKMAVGAKLKKEAKARRLAEKKRAAGGMGGGVATPAQAPPSPAPEAPAPKALPPPPPRPDVDIGMGELDDDGNLEGDD